MSLLITSSRDGGEGQDNLHQVPGTAGGKGERGSCEKKNTKQPDIYGVYDVCFDVDVFSRKKGGTDIACTCCRSQAI